MHDLSLNLKFEIRLQELRKSDMDHIIITPISSELNVV